MSQDAIDKKKIYKLIRSVFAVFSQQNGFSFYKNYILVRIQSDILHTICFDFGVGGLTCDIAIQPLYIPSEDIVLSFGNRISKFNVNLKERWSYGQTESAMEKSLVEIKELLEKNALPWFRETGHPQGIINFIENGSVNDQALILGLPDFLKRLYLGFSYLYQNEFKSGTMVLEGLEQILAEDSRLWAIRLKELSKNTRESVAISPDQVVEVLKQIAQETRQNLKLY